MCISMHFLVFMLTSNFALDMTHSNFALDMTQLLMRHRRSGGFLIQEIEVCSGDRCSQNF